MMYDFLRRDVWEEGNTKVEISINNLILLQFYGTKNK